MTDRLLYIGITHESAPLAIRESLRPDEAQRRAILERLAEIATGRLVLSTCERFELYAMTACTDTAVWVRLLANWFHLPATLIARHVQSLQGVSAARHLLRVAAGLESRIVGEAQILGQARDAFLLAQSTGSLEPHLNTLGRAAVRAGKRVRTETTLNAEARSIATITVDHLARVTGSLNGKSVLLLGTGSLAEVIAAELVTRRRASMTLTGRNFERGELLAKRSGASFRPLDRLPRLLDNADITIACTSSPTYIVHPAILHFGKPLILIDLSVPRNVDPEVVRVPGVRLWDIDELVAAQPIVLNGLVAANAIVEQELSKFVRWTRERVAAGRITSLLQSAATDTVGSPAELHGQIERIKAEVAA
jgi:glutamyl-tRNA reductase